MRIFDFAQLIDRLQGIRVDQAQCAQPLLFDDFAFSVIDNEVVCACYVARNPISSTSVDILCRLYKFQLRNRKDFSRIQISLNKANRVCLLVKIDRNRGDTRLALAEAVNSCMCLVKDSRL